MVTSDGKPKYPLLTKLAKAALVLPHSNADSERAFSIVGKIRTQFRSEMCQDTLCALLSCKMNTNGKASDYHPSKKMPLTRAFFFGGGGGGEGGIAL